MKHLKKYSLLLGILLTILINILSINFFHRLDMTEDKRYSISNPTKELMRKLPEQLSVTIYLDGDMNTGFLQLKRAVAELLDELSVYAAHNLQYHYCNPTTLTGIEQERLYEEFENLGIHPTVIHERNSEGKAVQRMLFPWAKITIGNRSETICLLKNIRGLSGEENLNISIENLEFAFTDATRLLCQTEITKIAFIEGHGELSEYHTWDISRALSRYFQIDRGQLNNDPSILSPYKAIIIASPREKFTEQDKFIIDQYIMNGGRVLWLLDGVQLDENSLSTTGISPTIPMDLNLTDMLFRYGVRINPMIIQDEQCLMVPVNVATEGTTPQFQPMPWYFAPLLLTSPNHSISRNIAQVSGSFVSCIDLVGDDTRIQKDILLASSNATHLISAPAAINVEEFEITENYFNIAHVPVGVALEGSFESVFAHRMIPEGIINTQNIRKESRLTKQIVLASGSFIGNEIENGQPLPVGYDRYSQTQFGNRDLLVNSLLYLTDDEGWINLRNKELTIRLLNKNISRTNKHLIQLINVVLPLICLALFGCIFLFVRRWKYTR
ncbi:MAG: gliding motility-associated ABC transporter substrate-binding protein GldG [Paludibacteraceae bacterium]|nr:gliding motility-associated ABC transporter substrate-binding protein GldG [Paludibacteraceae bacterium]